MKKQENNQWWVYVILNYLFLGFVLYYGIYPLIIPIFIISIYLTYYAINKLNNYKPNKNQNDKT
jgi:mannose/fructose/N-acetylgalactosamine-specific phosphotransferase system component IIC